MNLSVGIVGLPNVGKSTLFNALRSAQGKRSLAIVANYPFTTIEPNVGVVEVPDARLEKLADLIAKEGDSIAEFTLERSEGLQNDKRNWIDGHPPIIPAVVKFVDIAGLVKGAAQGEGLGNQFLAHIREVDAIIHVLRDFKDQNIVREGSISPSQDKLIVGTELGLADLQTLEKLIPVQEKEARIGTDPLQKQKMDILISIKNNLDKGRTLDELDEISDKRLKDWFLHLPLLTIKPVLYVYNVDEENYSAQTKIKDTPNDNSIFLCAKLEEELSSLSYDEQKEYLRELGVGESGLNRLIKKAYEALGLITFFTAGPKEVRAWTIKYGTLAPQAAGTIHGDFERGFIAADIIDWQKLVEAGGWQKAKAAGLIRTIGKSEKIDDGLVVEFKFSV